MAAQFGMQLHGTAIAYMEHAIEFTAPVKTVAEATARLLVKNNP
jgi:hypothetical protein